MWSLVNATPYAAERFFVRDRTGREIWVVSIKATFAIEPDGSTVLAKAQSELFVRPQFWGDPSATSLRVDTETLPHRPHTDVILNGTAYAPAGRSVTHLDVSLRVGSIFKELRVVGNRYWSKGVVGPRLSDAEPFESMAIKYERAYGGAEHRDGRTLVFPPNPVGTGYTTSRAGAPSQRAPNIEYPKYLIKSLEDRPPPAGFGPIAPSWQPRFTYAGTYDERWREERMPLVPEDFDARYYQCAPEDQQAVGYLKGGELVECQNLTPNGFLRFRLPRLASYCLTRVSHESIRSEFALVCVRIEPDERQLTMVWQTSVDCHHTLYTLEGSFLVEKRNVKLEGEGQQKSTSYEQIKHT